MNANVGMRPSAQLTAEENLRFTLRMLGRPADSAPAAAVDMVGVYDYVVEMLMKIFGHSQERAFQMAREVDAVTALLASLYPAWKASRVQPAEVLRYE